MLLCSSFDAQKKNLFTWIPAWLKQSCSKTRSMGWTRDALLDYSTCYIYPLGCACKPIQYQDSKFSSYKNMNHMYKYLMKDPQCCLVLPKWLTVSKLLPCFWFQRQACVDCFSHTIPIIHLFSDSSMLFPMKLSEN